VRRGDGLSSLLILIASCAGSAGSRRVLRRDPARVGRRRPLAWPGRSRLVTDSALFAAAYVTLASGAAPSVPGLVPLSPVQRSCLTRFVVLGPWIAKSEPVRNPSTR